MRFKFDRSDQSIYRCCFCCHVRTGTIFLGIFHLFAQLFLLSMFAVVALHPELMRDLDVENLKSLGEVYDPANDGTGTLLPIEESNNSNSSYLNLRNYYAYNWVRNRPWTNEDKFIFLLITVGVFAITIMLVYGAAKGRSSYLMPFFCLQVFDFCISCLTVVGYFSYIPDIKRWIAAQDNLPYKEEMLAMDDDWLMLLAILMFVTFLTIKAYFIGVVWACYKYLTGYERTLSNAVARGYQANATNPEDTEMLLPPKYEDVMAMPEPTPDPNQPPPPPYTAN